MILKEALPQSVVRKHGEIAVLGGTGLIGRHVIDALLAAGAADVVATYRARPPVERPGVNWRRADLLVPAEARMALEGARIAVICAGRVSTASELKRDPVASVIETLRIGVNLLEAASAYQLDQVILMSSCTAYPTGADTNDEAAMFVDDPPPSWFGVGWTHRFLEKQLEWYSRLLGRIGAGVVLRPTLVYGPHDDFGKESGHFVPSLIRRVVNRERPIEVWGDGTQSRNLIHAADVASAVVAALGKREAYAAYNIAAPASSSVNDVLASLLKLDGFGDAEIVHRMDLSGGASSLDVSAAAFQDRYGWQAAMSLEEGLAQTMCWYRNSFAKLAETKRPEGSQLLPPTGARS